MSAPKSFAVLLAENNWLPSFVAAFNVDSTAWNGVNLRQLVAAAALSYSGSRVRLALTSSLAAGGMVLDHCYLGHAAGAGDAYDFDGTQVQVTFGGAAGVTIGQDVTVYSDIITYALDKTKNFIVAAHFNGVTSVRANLSQANCTKYEKTAADQTSTADVTGYSSAAGVRMVSRIEVYP